MTNAKIKFRIGKEIVKYAQIAQSVEQRTENPRVGGSIPPLGTKQARLARRRPSMEWSCGARKPVRRPERTLHGMVVRSTKPVRTKTRFYEALPYYRTMFSALISEINGY